MSKNMYKTLVKRLGGTKRGDCRGAASRKGVQDVHLVGREEASGKPLGPGISGDGWGVPGVASPCLGLCSEVPLTHIISIRTIGSESLTLLEPLGKLGGWKYEALG
jgi:hypothetical protein